MLGDMTTATPRATTLHTAMHGTRRIVVQRIENQDPRRASRYLYQLLIDDINVVSVRSDDDALIYALPQFANVLVRDRPARSAEPDDLDKLVTERPLPPD